MMVYVLLRMGEQLYKVATFATKAGVASTTIYSMIKAAKENSDKQIHIKFVERPRGSKTMYLIPESELTKFSKDYK